MKKIIRSILRLFHHIGSFFDKWLITPITKFILRITDLFKDNSKSFERFLSKKSTLIVISLILAFLVFVLIDQESSVMTDQYAEILYKQPVTAVYNEELYVVEGLPKAVDITLVGEKRHIFLAKQSPSKGVSVDLTGLGEGNHKVTLKYTQKLKSLDYKLDPATVTVTIYPKVSETMSLTYDILHQDDLDSKLSINNVELNRDDVIIKGAEYKLKKVATVKALVDVDKIAKNKLEDVVAKKSGEISLDNVDLVAYDTDGKVVDVEIVPKSVTAKVSITSPSKEVPIKIIPKGKLATGKSIKSTDLSISKVTVYGDEETINAIEYFPVEIDVDGLTANKTYKVTLKKPSGITEVSAKTLTVNVVVDSSTSKEMPDISIATENLDSKYKVQALSEADSKVIVVVKGSQDVVSKIDASSITAYIDLKGYGVGEHEVDVKVKGEDLRVTYSSKTAKVKIKISEK